MSFLDIQDLATLAAQIDLDSVWAAWRGEAKIILGALEVGLIGAAAGLIGRRRAAR